MWAVQVFTHNLTNSNEVFQNHVNHIPSKLSNNFVDIHGIKLCKEVLNLKHFNRKTFFFYTSEKNDGLSLSDYRNTQPVRICDMFYILLLPFFIETIRTQMIQTRQDDPAGMTFKTLTTTCSQQVEPIMNNIKFRIILF